MNAEIIDVIQELTETLLELHARKAALDMAVKASRTGDASGIVVSAETFYNFINGTKGQ